MNKVLFLPEGSINTKYYAYRNMILAIAKELVKNKDVNSITIGAITNDKEFKGKRLIDKKHQHECNITRKEFDKYFLVNTTEEKNIEFLTENEDYRSDTVYEFSKLFIKTRRYK